MPRIIDQYGNAIEPSALAEPQTSRVAWLQHQTLTPMLAGLTPTRLAATLRAADEGNLVEQHRLFADMEERDAHLRAEIDKRRSALTMLDWDIVAPPDATAAEKATVQWVEDVLKNAIDPMEDLILTLMEAVGHGFGVVELEWSRWGGELLPSFHPRPQEWFCLDQSRTEIRLRSAAAYGEVLRPFGWVWHAPSKAKTGYGGRLGLHRTLSWPFIYKVYALSDFAEYLETFGLPIIVGKYHNGASADERSSLLRAVTALGHDARAIMPADMQLEINKVAGGGGSSGDTPHLAMLAWCEKAMSKAILGQTLTTEGGAVGSGGYALGQVHAAVRRDILRADARSLAATLTRDLVYPLIALNRQGAGQLDPRRCPQLRFELNEAEDIAIYADALPKLLSVGLRIDRAWVQEKLRIPEPEHEDNLLVMQHAPAGMEGMNPYLTGLRAHPNGEPARGVMANLAEIPGGLPPKYPRLSWPLRQK